MAAHASLTDEEVHEALVKARELLGHAPGSTKRGNETLETIRRALEIAQIALVHAMEEDIDHGPSLWDVLGGDTGDW